MKNGVGEGRDGGGNKGNVIHKADRTSKESNHYLYFFLSLSYVLMIGDIKVFHVMKDIRLLFILQPPGEGARLPEVFCVMSPVPCYPLYFQLLDEIERRRKHSMEEVEVLLKVAYEKILPRPVNLVTY